MNFKNHYNVIIGTLLLLNLVSCGGKDDKSHTTKQQLNPVCSEMDCLSSINWKIFLPGRSFPFKTRIDINGSTVLNECVSKQKYSIDREADPEVVVLENFMIPKKGQVKINVVDLGYDCDSESTFIKNDNVDFEYNKNAESAEIVINL